MVVKEHDRRCFNNYNHLKYYWIIDGPRYAVMIVSLVVKFQFELIFFFEDQYYFLIKYYSSFIG
jgi:hypothetical protein